MTASAQKVSAEWRRSVKRTQHAWPLLERCLPAGAVVLDKNENKKCMTKRHPDGRSLSMLVVSGVILEKHMTCKVLWGRALVTVCEMWTHVCWGASFLGGIRHQDVGKGTRLNQGPFVCCGDAEFRVWGIGG